MMAVRDGELAAGALGVDAARTKILAFGISSAFAGLAGGLYALAHPVVTLEPFNLHMSVEFIAIVVLGGVGTTFGAVSGAIAFLLLHPLASQLGATYPFRAFSSEHRAALLFYRSSVSFSSLNHLVFMGSGFELNATFLLGHFVLTMFTWIIDLALALIKWPVALLALLVLPFAADAFWDSLTQLTMNGIGPNDFLMGALVYFVAWLFIFRSKLVGSYLSTLEHELTHALFRDADLTSGKRTKSNRLRGRTHHVQRRHGQLAHHDFALFCSNDVVSPLACSSLARAYTSLRVHPGSYHELPHHVNISGNTRGTDRPSKDRQTLCLVLFTERESSLVYLCLCLERRRLR